MTFAILGIICFVLLLNVSSVLETIEKHAANITKSLGDLDLKTYLLVILGVCILLDIWYFYLITRCATSKSKGTLLLVLLVLSIATGIVQMLTTKSFYDLSLIIDAITLFGLYHFKKRKSIIIKTLT